MRRQIVAAPPTIPGSLNVESMSANVLKVVTELIGSGSISTWKGAARVATTVAITLSGIQAIDGITLVDGNVVLVKNQGGADNVPDVANGLYVAASGDWERTTDYATDSNGDGAAVFITEGGTYSDKIFVEITDNSTVGTTALEFATLSAVPSPSGGIGDVQFNLDNISMSGNSDFTYDGSGAVTATGKITGLQFESTVANGTAPFLVTSSTEVSGLTATTATTADSADALAAGATGVDLTLGGALSGVTTLGVSGVITSGVTTGTGDAPFIVNSTVEVENLRSATTVLADSASGLAANATLVTPNIGAATGDSLNVTGDVNGLNLVATNKLNIPFGEVTLVAGQATVSTDELTINSIILTHVKSQNAAGATGLYVQATIIATGVGGSFSLQSRAATAVVVATDIANYYWIIHN
jgi:hypothetical protein